MIFHLSRWYLGDQICNGEMSGACDMQWERSETQIELWWGNLKGGDILEGLGVGGRVISR